MSWHTKRKDGPKYYYRSYRVEGRAVKEYIGTGPLAETAARMDEVQRQERQAQREASRQEQGKALVAEQTLQDLQDMADLLTRAVLLAAGLHQHKGQWRRIRHARDGRDGAQS